MRPHLPNTVGKGRCIGKTVGLSALHKLVIAVCLNGRHGYFLFGDGNEFLAVRSFPFLLDVVFFLAILGLHKLTVSGTYFLLLYPILLSFFIGV
jgi:hypothetical protein